MTARTLRGTHGKPSLTVLGDLLLEVAVTADRPIEDGTDVPGSIRVRRGGSAANTAVAFARLGGRSALISSVGRDRLAERLLQAVRAANVTPHVARVDAPTGRLLAMIDRAGERSFVTERGAADGLQPTDLRVSWLRGAAALHLPGYSLYNRPVSEAATSAVEAIRAGGSGAIVSVDLSSRGPLLAFGRWEAWRVISGLAPDVLFANAAEAASLVRGAAHERLLDLASVVVVKEGAAGCRVLWRGVHESAEQLAVAATRIASTDTTGAGDAFAAGFLFALLTGTGTTGGRASGAATARWSGAHLRRAALGGHRAAADLLRGPRAELAL